MMVIVIVLIMMMMVIMMVIIMVMILVVMAVMMMMIKTMVVDPPICLLQLSSFFRFVLPLSFSGIVVFLYSPFSAQFHLQTLWCVTVRVRGVLQLFRNTMSVGGGLKY